MYTKAIFVGFLTCLSLFFLSCSNSNDDSNEGSEIVNIDKDCTQIVNIPDANFKAKLLSSSKTNAITYTIYGEAFKIDENNDGEIQFCEAEKVGWLLIPKSDINSLEGIQAFSNLILLRCEENKLKSLDLTHSLKLATIHCNNNELTILDVSGLNELKTLYFNNNKISSLNIRNSNNIVDFRGYYNSLTVLSVSGLKKLQYLYIGHNFLTNLNVENLENLENIGCTSNNLIEINATNCIKLFGLECSQNSITSLKLKNCKKLSNLNCWSNKLSTLDTSDLIELFNLDLSNNKMISLDLRNSKKIEYLEISSNNLESLIVKNESSFRSYFIAYNPNLKYICCDDIEKSDFISKTTFYGYNCNVVSDCF